MIKHKQELFPKFTVYKKKEWVAKKSQCQVVSFSGDPKKGMCHLL